MNNVITFIEQNSFLSLIWIFFVIFMLHEFEEWNIDQFEHRNFIGLPPTATDRSARMWIGFVCLVGLIWTAAATIPGDATLAAWIFLPAIAILVQNALQHVYWSFLFKQAAPGVFTAGLVILPFGSYLIIKAVEPGYLPVWYVAIWVGFILLGSIQTITAGNKMTPLIRGINNIGIWLSDRIK